MKITQSYLAHVLVTILVGFVWIEIASAADRDILTVYYAKNETPPETITFDAITTPDCTNNSNKAGWGHWNNLCFYRYVNNGRKLANVRIPNNNLRLVFRRCRSNDNYIYSISCKGYSSSKKEEYLLESGQKLITENFTDRVTVIVRKCHSWPLNWWCWDEEKVSYLPGTRKVWKPL